MSAGEGQNVELVVPEAIVREQPVLVDHGGNPSDATKTIPVLPYGTEQSRWFIKRLQETRRDHWALPEARVSLGALSRPLVS